MEIDDSWNSNAAELCNHGGYYRTLSCRQGSHATSSLPGKPLSSGEGRPEGDGRGVAEGGRTIEPARLEIQARKPAMDATILITDAAGQSRDALSRLRYRIHLKIPPVDREDAWELCRVVLRYGGVEICDCCFAFASAERRLMALESLRFQFGPEYFEAVESTEINHA